MNIVLSCLEAHSKDTQFLCVYVYMYEVLFTKPNTFFPKEKISLSFILNLYILNPILLPSKKYIY
nr:MAG TPA: hypothetical protein [Caudoviricetes sp.]